jgi:hypothetical protein
VIAFLVGSLASIICGQQELLQARDNLYSKLPVKLDSNGTNRNSNKNINNNYKIKQRKYNVVQCQSLTIASKGRLYAASHQ